MDEGLLIFLLIMIPVLVVAVWVIVWQSKANKGIDGYVGNSKSEPQIYKKEDEFYNITAYSIDDMGGFMRLRPHVNIKDNTVNLLLFFYIKQFKGLESVIVKIDNEIRTFNSETTTRYSTSTATTYGTLNSHIYTSSTQYNTYSLEEFSVYLTKEDILFFSKIAKCQTAKIRFQGIGMQDFDIGIYEKKSMIKMINMLNDFAKKGYKFINPDEQLKNVNKLTQEVQKALEMEKRLKK